MLSLPVLGHALLCSPLGYTCTGKTHVDPRYVFQRAKKMHLCLFTFVNASPTLKWPSLSKQAVLPKILALGGHMLSPLAQVIGSLGKTRAGADG